MQITIVGAGNLGLTLVGYLCQKNDCNITIFTSKNIIKNGGIVFYDVEENIKTKISNFNVTSNPNLAFENADIILCTYPAFLKIDFVKNYGHLFKATSIVGFIPGYGGVEYYCSNLIKRGITIFGLQRVPYIARSENENGVYKAKILSKKRKLYCAAIPRAQTKRISKIITTLLDIYCEPLQEYLSVTLAPSNPLLHLTGLYNVCHMHDRNYDYKKPLHFYDEWNDETSRMLFQYDQELQLICNNMQPLDLHEIISLPKYYESETPEKMTKKLKSIEAFKAVMVPLKQSCNHYYIDLSSRMFKEDFPYGICIIKDFAVMTGTKTPTIDLLLKFYEKLSGHKYFDKNGEYTSEIKDTGVPSNNGFTTKDKIIEFYHQ